LALCCTDQELGEVSPSIHFQPLKGGKRHEMPAHHKLEQFLDEYRAAAFSTTPRRSLQ
jgi:hypothetical protein